MAETEDFSIAQIAEARGVEPHTLDTNANIHKLTAVIDIMKLDSYIDIRGLCETCGRKHTVCESDTKCENIRKQLQLIITRGNMKLCGSHTENDPAVLAARLFLGISSMLYEKKSNE